jgi:hypothetical protein
MCIKLNKVQIIIQEFHYEMLLDILSGISKLYCFIMHMKEVINMSKNNSKKKSGTKGTKDKQQKNNQKGNTVG